MTLVEKIASLLSLVGVPTGHLNPGNLVVDASSSFVKADELEKHGISIPGRTMSTEEFIAAARDYIGIDLVSEVYDEAVHSGINIREHSKLLAQRMVESKDEHPEYFEECIQEITRNITKAQDKLRG